MRRILRSTNRMRPGLGLERLEGRLTLSHAPLANAPLPFEADAPLPFEIEENDRFAPEALPAMPEPPSFSTWSHGETSWSAPNSSGGPYERLSGFGGDFSPRMHFMQPMAVQVQFVLVLVDFDFGPGDFGPGDYGPGDYAPEGGSASAPGPSPSHSDAPPRGRVEPAAIASSTITEASSAGEDVTPSQAAARPAPTVGVSVLPVAVASAAPSATVVTNVAPMLPPSGSGASIAQLQPSLMEPTLIPPRGEPLPSRPQSSDVAPVASAPSAVPSKAPEAQGDSEQAKSLPTIAKSEQAPLLAGMSLNIEAIDAALQAMLADVEVAGSELVSWLDEVSPRSWVSMAATAVLAGAAGRYAWRARRRRQVNEPWEEESSSWLFTRFQSH